MREKLISIGYAVPELSYTQDQIFELIGYPKGWLRFFRGSGIDKRHFCIPLTQAMKLSLQEQQDLYIPKATELSCQVILKCLDGRDQKKINRVVYGSCTGLAPGPTIAHYFSAKLGFAPNVFVANNSAMGCEGAFPGLKIALDHVKANGGMALAVNCELSSLVFWPEDDVARRPDPENDFEVARANAVFADGAMAALVGYDDDWRHPYILDMETYTEPKYADELGFIWRNGRLRVRLSRRVPELAPLVVKPAVDAVLSRMNMRVPDVRWWVIHAAGNIVIDNIGRALNLPEEKLFLSRETLRLYGNTSSTSVGITGKRLMSESIQPGDYIMMLSVGPGMSGGATCLRFGDKRVVAIVGNESEMKRKEINIAWSGAMV